MDDENYEITGEIEDRINAFIEEKKILDHSCPACGTKDWHLASTLFGISNYSTTKGLILDRFAPLFALICTNCTKMEFYSAGASGVLKKRMAKKKVDDATEE